MTYSKIRVLSEHTINKIAAGEVIENPSSVVKELVENSLDAGAKNICIEIKEGGRQLIRITDDGCGMSSDDALLCLERHATSKIKEVEDIESLLTMGFRGEAVPSIASISKFTLLTCLNQPEKKNEGTLIIVDGGKILSTSVAPRSPGTTIEVKALFFNVPVRRKFQKSPSYDAQEIQKIIGFFALAYPSIQFELISDQKQVFKTPLESSQLSFHEMLGKRIETVYGKEIRKSLIPLCFQQGPYELLGYISSPSTHKHNRSGQHLFINQRLVSCASVSVAVREGYGPMLPNQRYPLFTIHLRMPGDLLDVNVHPQKKEVRLRKEFQLKEMIIQSIQSALNQETQPGTLPPTKAASNIPPFWGPYASLLSPDAISSSKKSSWEFRSEGQEQVNHSNEYENCNQAIYSKSSSCFKIEENRDSLSHSVPDTITQTDFPSIPSSLPAFPPTYRSDLSVLSPHMTPPIRVIATLIGYCLLEPFQLMPLLAHSGPYQEGGLALLDQRAAYSRIHYEKLLKRTTTQDSQTLLIPITLHLNSFECQALREYGSPLNEMGFEFREFGDQTFVIDAFPGFLKQDQLQSCIQQLIQDLVDMQSSRHMHLKREEHLAIIACRASLPKTKRLSIEEAQGLLHQLLQCECPSKCPMGKSTCLYLTPDELSKLFQKN